MNQQFSNIFKQLQTIWAQLGLNQRITIVATTLAVVAGVSWLAFWSSSPAFSLLYARLDEAEASKVIAYLEESKIPYRIGRGGGAIMVPGDKVHITRMQLAAKGVPRGEGVGFEIFDRSNFGISDFVQRANYLRAVQGELARTISQVDQVESARVMIVMPENRLVVNDKNKPTASVFVKVRANAQLLPQSVTAIRFLVANAVEGLQVSNVSVVDNSGNVLSDTTDIDSAAGITQTQLEVRKRLEQYLSKKAEGMLESVMGPGMAVVRVSADINFDTVTRTEERYDPESQVIRTSTTTDENTESLSGTVTPAAAGLLNANGETNSTAAYPQNNNRVRKKVLNTQYEINKITSNMVQSAGNVTRVSAAVFIAARMEGTGSERKIVPRSPEEIEKIRKIVQSALGIQGNGDSGRKDEITLEEFPFNDQTATELTQNLEKENKLQFWLHVAQNSVYPLMAIGLLLVLWRMLKRAPDVDIPIGVPVGDGNGTGTHSGNTTAGGRLPQGIVTIDVLNQLIRENPQNMTQAIRGWMTEGRRK